MYYSTLCGFCPIFLMDLPMSAVLGIEPRTSHSPASALPLSQFSDHSPSQQSVSPPGTLAWVLRDGHGFITTATIKIEKVSTIPESSMVPQGHQSPFPPAAPKCVIETCQMSPKTTIVISLPRFPVARPSLPLTPSAELFSTAHSLTFHPNLSP